ncbi:hypothetical protein [Microbulbifer sp. JMSA008]|uniref:hypothetical protein n=1 Tax=Microbulbifer sp. JMSA008 TaxID=3243373 RepID=UPI00403933D0
MRKCILHIGMSKSGTSFIQRSLELNKKNLTSNGLVPFFRPRVLPACFIEPNCKVSIFRELGLKNYNEIKQFQRNRLEMITKKLKKSKNVIFSSEWLCGFGEEQISSLYKFIEPYFDEVNIVVYFRRQDRYATSLYNLSLITGSTNSEIIPSKDALNFRYNYSEILNIWRKQFGISAIKPRIFEKNLFVKKDFFYDFFRLCGLKNISNYKKPDVSNESLNPAAQEFLRISNKFLLRFNDNKPNKNRKEIIKILKSNFSGKGRLPRRDIAIDFYNNFKEANRKMFKEYSFGDAKGFNNNFMEYPDSETSQFTDEEIFHVFSKVKYHLKKIERDDLSHILDRSLKNELEDRTLDKMDF